MADSYHISGIQQVGIGNPAVATTWAYYRKNFGFDVPVFEEEAEAGLMLPYTGGQPHKRRAVLALNMNGGGGLEIWQYTERELLWPKTPVLPGDLGIQVLKIKTRSLAEAEQDIKAKKLEVLAYSPSGDGKPAGLYLKDLYGNIVELTESPYWYKAKGGLYGGVAGVTIGVTDLKKAMDFYAGLLGFDRILAEWEGEDAALAAWAEKDYRYRRVLLERTAPYHGPFSPLLGPARIELIQVLDREPQKIFAKRYWGDPGFIHLCFDVVGMEALQKKAEALGHPFTVDSAESFDMGEAAGRFAYVEDPDGTLIEFVETHKVPILKKLNWYLNLKGRPPKKPLPRFMINALSLSRVK